MKKLLLLLLPITLILCGCNITYDDSCETIAMDRCYWYDYYKFNTHWNWTHSNSICEIQCLNQITWETINLDVLLNKNRF